MLKLNLFALYYDIIAYLVAARSLIDEILYKLGYKRHVDVDKDLAANLTGHVAIVTGGTRGLGLTVVRALISKGCRVFVGSSQTDNKFPQIAEKIYDGLPEIHQETKVRRGEVCLEHLDLSRMESVQNFVKSFKRSHTSLNFLICNAGIMFAPRSITGDGFESHLAVNYLGHSLLILELLDELRRASEGSPLKSRIICVSSSTHYITGFRFDDLTAKINYSSSQAYAQSKLAQIMFSAKLSRILQESFKTSKVQCFSLHPGVVLSELYEHVHLIKYFPFLIPLIKLVTRDVVQGAETTLFATLTPELDTTNGNYLEDCAIKNPSSRSANEGDQQKLFDLTIQLLDPWLSEDSKRFVGRSNHWGA